jgi:hypothetical protein
MSDWRKGNQNSRQEYTDRPIKDFIYKNRSTKINKDIFGNRNESLLQCRR